MLLIGSLGAMWAWWGKQFHEPKCGSGHVYRVMAWTRQQGLVPGSWERPNGNEGVLRIPQSSSITGTSPLDCLVSYPGHSLGGLTPSGEVQSVYSTVLADWAIHRVKCQKVLFQIIQFSMSTKQFYFEQFSLALVRSLNVKTVLF